MKTYLCPSCSLPINIDPQDLRQNIEVFCDSCGDAVRPSQCKIVIAPTKNVIPRG